MTNNDQQTLATVTAATICAFAVALISSEIEAGLILASFHAG